MFIKEAKELLQNLGYSIIKESNDEYTEKEFTDKVTEEVLKIAEEQNFTVNKEDLDTIVFEAYSKDMDIETAIKAVWKGIYLDTEAEPQEIE